MAATLTFRDLDSARSAHAGGLITDAALAHCERAFGAGIDPPEITVECGYSYDVATRTRRHDQIDVGAEFARAIWDGAGGDR